VVWAEGLLADRQRALVERLGLDVPALLCVERGQVVEAVGDVGMVWAECLLLDRQGTLEQRLGSTDTITSADLSLRKDGVNA
jgi:hypothetical protein